MIQKIIKLIKDPIGVFKRRFFPFFEKRKYRGANGYRAGKYWDDRLRQYGFDLRGVGNAALPNNVNEQMYQEAEKIFIDLCRKEKIDFQNVHFLDIGCGVGFYAQIFLKNGGAQYTGIDITDALFPQLRRRYPSFQFQQLDISTQPFEGMFDCIIMIDTTQHITHGEKFSYAMRNIRSHLNPSGVFIVTSWLSEDARSSFYEVSRPLESYQNEFPGYKFSEPVSFRDKFIFSIKKS